MAHPGLTPAISATKVRISSKTSETGLPLVLLDCMAFSARVLHKP
ncbi:MAG: hypothetical protein RBQ72_00875 [Desulfobacterium sp.]|nr:hypothetical protein [Desulfobacterium sp.]